MDSTPDGEEPAAPVTDDIGTDIEAAPSPRQVAVPLPPPPEPIRTPGWFEHRRARPGQLTPAWRVVFGLAWVGIVLAFAAVWKSGRTLGLSPWWLGPSGDPNNLLIKMIPFVPSIVVIVLAMRNVRYLPWVGIAASLGLAGIAAGDLDRFNGIAVVEFASAAAGLLVSIAAFAGLLRATEAPVGSAPDAPVPDAPEAPDDVIDVLRPPVTQ